MATNSLLIGLILNLMFVKCVVLGAPNVVIILADDMGFDDVSFRGSNEFLTPNIDALAYNGVILNRYYVPSMCTPSRAALMTGKNPINTGMQHYVIPNVEPWGLPLTEKTLAQFFQEAGYFTSLIGKWHLGFAEKAYTPLYRGFDHHYGYLGAYVDYYDQTLYTSGRFARGHDFRNNLNITRKNQGTYVTDSLTDEAIRLITDHDKKKPLMMLLSHLAPHTGNSDNPLQAPEEEISKFEYIADTNRRLYAAMVSKLDDSVGKIVNTLNTKGILENTIILFYSDNGAPCIGMHANNGSNYPFRGQKNSPWEGGIRSSAAIWSALIGNHGQVWDQTMHAIDLLPTLAAAAGIKLEQTLNLDGINLWPRLTTCAPPVPRKLVHNIDDIFKYAAYSSNQWKYVNGTTEFGNYDGWLKARDNVHIDPKSEYYVDLVKESLAWKNLAPLTQKEMKSIDIKKIREKAAVTCGFEKEVSRCEPLVDECIFNINDDPCEQNNLINNMRDSEVLRTIREEVNNLRREAKVPVNKPMDPKCDPKLYNYEWTWWKDIEV